MIKEFLAKVVAGEVGLEEQVSFLEEYAVEKVGAPQVAEFVEFMEAHIAAPLDLPGAIDICGTGGSGLPRINTSTISAFLLADMGVGVAKHGNKAASGRFGSFDLLEELGVKIDLGKEELEKTYADMGLAFIYARSFHPVMKHFVEARKAIGKPTVFNLLGPLLSPARPTRQIIGTSFADQMMLIAETCKLIGKERVMVVRAKNGLDEVSLEGETKVVELVNGEIKEYVLSAADFGLEACSFEEIAGGDREFNLQVARDVLARKCESRHADLVCVNAALALRLAGKEDDLRQGVEMARKADGAASLKRYMGGAASEVPSILVKIAAGKKLAKSDRDFKAALQREGVSLIAEFKNASPSAGKIAQNAFQPAEVGRTYESAGADAMSVLTDAEHFGGSFENFRAVREATSGIPLLCKDFLISDYQVRKARDFGADAVLLIAALLSEEEISRMMTLAMDLGMDSLVEVHNERELEKVLRTEAEIIGINNRDLNTFEIDMGTTERLVKMIPEGKLVVAESGMQSGSDVAGLPERVDAVLIGTAIMSAGDSLGALGDKIQEFKNI